MSIFCLLRVRDDERYLPGFLHHIAPHVDGIVALDDGSTDSIPDILQREPKVLSLLHQHPAGPAPADECSDGYRLTLEAARLGARWVLCAEADERFEEGFLWRLRAEARKGEWWRRPVRAVELVSLWDGVDRYRLDGQYGPCWSARMFRIPLCLSSRRPGASQPWLPPELDGVRAVKMRAVLYRLGTIEPAEREARLVRSANLAAQGAGLGRPGDETGLRLQRVDPRRGYASLEAPPADSLPRPARPRAGCRADAAFARRFRLDHNSYEGPHTSVVTETRSRFGGQQQSTLPRETSRFYGFDFAAIFADVRARRHGVIAGADETE